MRLSDFDKHFPFFKNHFHQVKEKNLFKNYRKTSNMRKAIDHETKMKIKSI